MSFPRQVSFALLVLSVMLCACYSVEALPESRQVLEDFFEELRADDFEAALARYHPSFFDERSREGWRQTLAQRGSKIGAPQEYRLHRRKVFFGVKQAGAGTYVTLGYSVRYDRGTTEETFILYRGSDQEPPVITHHRLESTEYGDDTRG
jgi:hypothetical protein